MTHGTWQTSTASNINSEMKDIGTPPLTRFFGTEKNSVKGKPRYRRNILVLKSQNGEYGSSKSTF